MTRDGRADGDTTDGRTGDDHVHQRLYRIMSDPSLSSAEKRQRLLELGVERLGVENGHVVRVDRGSDRHEIVAANGSDIVRAGDVTSLDETYCRETITSDDVLTIYDAHEQGWGDDPAVQAWDITCYIGTKLLVGNDLYGTVCFVDSDSRDARFSAEEQSFVDLLSSSISRLLERDDHEQTLKREQEWSRLFVEEVSDYAIFMLDPAGHVVSWNKGARAIKGYAEDEIVGEHLSRFYPADDRSRGRPEKLLEEARRTGRVTDEGWRVRKDGSRFWALVSITALHDEDGTLRGFGKVTRDVTERRATKQALEAEKAFIERALNTLDDVFFVLAPDGGIERVNQRWLDVTGYSEDETLSMDPDEFFVPEDREAVVESVAEALETGEMTVEATLLTKENERRRYELRGKRLTDDDGAVTGVVGIGRDITERKLYDERLEVAQRVLRHNLRNELNVIQGWVETLSETATGTQQNAVDRILNAIDQLIDLTEHTRQMVELDPGPIDDQATVDVTTRLPAIVAEFRSEKPRATVELDLPADELSLSTDERAETAITNAIENAIEHNPSDEPWVGLVVEREHGRVLIHVHDDGPGIPEMEQRVIERGEETPLEHGTGIGLWLVYWCVTTAGGEVTFDDRTPRGSTITLGFPLANET